jgi:hypothetical protein
MRILAVLLLSLFANSVWAATWYVRPATGEYGAEDGTTYATAYDGFGDINWVADIDAGDTLIVCGTFNDNAALNVADSGTAGNVITVDGDCSSHGDLSMAKIAAGTAAVAASNGNQAYITFKNLELVGGSGITQRVFNITAASATSATEINNILYNIIVHDTMGEGAASRSVDYQCLRVDGSKVTASNITLYNCEGDGVYAEGNDHTWADINISNVDLSATPYGDCIQYGGGSNSIEYAHNRVTITRLNCDRTNKATKHGVIFGCDSGAGTSTGLVLQGSVIRGAAYNVSVNFCDDVTIRRNVLVPNSIAGGEARGVGTFNGSSGETINVESNVFDMQNVAENSYGIFIDQSAGFTLNARNNTFYGNGDETGTRGIYVYLPAAGTANVQNNVFHGMVIAGIQSGAGVTWSATHNAFFANGATCTGVTCASSVTTDPRFLGGSSPTTAEGFKPDCIASPLKNAGTNVGQVQDFTGRYFDDQPDIGAFACQGGTPRTTPTARAVSTQRTTPTARAAAEARP